MVQPPLAERGDQVEHRDPLLLQVAQRARHVQHEVLVREAERGAAGQREEQVAEDHVEGQPGRHGAAVAGADAEPLALPGEQVAPRIVAAQHTLRDAGAAGREVDVARVRGLDRREGGPAARGGARQHAGGGLQAGGGDVGQLGQERSRPGRGARPEQAAGAADLEHLALALQRQPAVQRHDDGAGHQGAEEGREQARAGLAADRHALAGPRGPGQQVARDRLRALAQLAVARLPAGVPDRHPVRRAVGPAAEQVGHGHVPGPVQRRRQVGQDPAGRRRHQRDLADRRVGRRRRGGQELDELVGQSSHLLGREQVAVVQEVEAGPGPGAVGVVGDVQREGLAGVRGRLEPRRAAREAPQLHRRAGRHEAHLDIGQRVAGVLALGLEALHQLLERDVVGERVQARLAQAADQLPERRGPRHVGAQDQQVGQVADQVLALGELAVRDRHADHHVVLAGAPGEQRGEGGEDGHGRRGAQPPGERAQRRGGVRRQRARLQAGAERGDPWSRPVARQLQRGRVREPRPPVVEAALEAGIRRLLALPGRVVQVRQRELGERGRLAGREGAVQGAQLALEDARRPAVHDDVVERHDQQVVALAEPDQVGPDRRPGPQVERADSGMPGELQRARLPERFGDLADVRDGHDEPGLGVHHLDRAVAAVLVSRPQHLVPAGDLVEAPVQRVHVQGAGQPVRQPGVIDGAPGDEHVQEPQPLLGGGERDRRCRPAAPGRRRPGRALAAQPQLEQRSLLGRRFDRRRGRARAGPSSVLDHRATTSW